MIRLGMIPALALLALPATTLSQTAGTTPPVGQRSVPAGRTVTQPGQPNDPRGGATRVMTGTTAGDDDANGALIGGGRSGGVGDPKPPKLDAAVALGASARTRGSASTTDGSGPSGGPVGGTIGGGVGGGPKSAAALGSASNVSVQQGTRSGVGGAAGEAGSCCKPKELQARAGMADGSVHPAQQAATPPPAGAAVREPAPR